MEQSKFAGGLKDPRVGAARSNLQQALSEPNVISRTFECACCGKMYDKFKKYRAHMDKATCTPASAYVVSSVTPTQVSSVTSTTPSTQVPTVAAHQLQILDEIKERIDTLIVLSTEICAQEQQVSNTKAQRLLEYCRGLYLGMGGGGIEHQNTGDIYFQAGFLKARAVIDRAIIEPQCK